jgi:tetratricopeptide (TPR) repeat protein
MAQVEDKNGTRIGVLLAIVTFLVYSNSLWNGFVWDDAVVILANIPRITSSLDIFSSIDAGRSIDVAPYYRPLSLLSFYGEYRLHGLNPYLVRLVSLLLHAGNTFLLYRLALTLFSRRKAAFFAALLFSLHPIHAEAVDFNSARSTLLVTLFCLLALLLHRKAVVQNSFLPALGGAASAFAGLLSKEIALGVIPFIVALEISRWRTEPLTWRNALTRLTPYLVVTLLYWTLRSRALALADVKLEIFPGMLTRLMYNAYIIPKYLFSLVWPVNLSPFYLIPEELRPIALQLLFSWMIIAVAFWLLIRYGTRTTVRFGLSWLVIFWLPVSGIVDIPSSPVADRYFYIPAIGLWVLAGDLLARFCDAETGKRGIRYAAIIVLFVCLTALTFRQNRYWNNGVTLFSRVLQLAPESVYAYHNLGCAYLEEQHNLPLAEKAFMHAMMLDPSFPRLQDKLGYIRMQRGDYYGALQHYGEAIRQNPIDAEAHLNSAILLEKLSRFEEALVEYQLFYASPGDELAEARSRFRGKIDELSRLIAKRKVAAK